MNFQTDSNVSQVDVTSSATSAISERSSQRTSSNAGSFDSVSIVGMNVNMIPDIVVKIHNYCQQIQAEIRTLDTETSIDMYGAIRGLDSALSIYMNHVVTYCANLVSNLELFGDLLTDARTQWEKQAGEIESKIVNETSNYYTGTNYTS